MDGLHARAEGVEGKGKLVDRIEYTAVLKGEKGIHSGVPVQDFGSILVSLQPVVRKSVLMEFAGRSAITGRSPEWLAAAADVRLLNVDVNGDVRMRLALPDLGTAAPQLYRQEEFWPAKPAPDRTGLDIMARTLRDIRAHEANSDRFDGGLLQSVTQLGQVFAGTIHEITIQPKGRDDHSVALLDRQLTSNAAELRAQTPHSASVRVVGKLDMIRDSTRTFAIKTKGGLEVRGVYLAGDVEPLRELFRREVLVVGMAVYRPSGNVLRIDARAVLPAEGEAEIWTHVPRPMRRTLTKRDVSRRQTSGTGAARIFGRWPGDEKEEDLLAALEASD